MRGDGVASGTLKVSSTILRASLGGAAVKNPPVSVGDRFHPWVGKLPLEEEMATHRSTLACLHRIPWTKEPGGQQSKGSQRLEHD